MSNLVFVAAKRESFLSVEETRYLGSVAESDIVGRSIILPEVAIACGMGIGESLVDNQGSLKLFS